MISAPLLLLGMLVGIIVAIFQAVTQIHEQSLSFILKLIVVVIVLLVGGDWMLERLKMLTGGDYADVRVVILGPSPAAVPKVNNKYRYRMIIKCRNNARFRQLLQDCLAQFGRRFSGKQVTAYLDMNPEGIV